MTFSIPNTAHEFLVLLVPFLTLALGMGFFLAPKRIFRFMGLQPIDGRREAIGEGRSSFAGAMIALSLACLMLQEPLALQPGLNFMLAAAWTISAIGRVLQMTLDGAWRRKRIQVRFIIAVGLAAMAVSVTNVPIFVCVDYFNTSCALPGNTREWFLSLLALLMFGLGLIALFIPGLALRIMFLEPRKNTPFARGEPRGTLAGLYMAIGGTYLLQPQPIDFTALVLGAAWLFTGIGRLVSIIFDRGWTVYNVVAFVFEAGVGLIAIGFVLGWL
ncbi:MAG: DUF4345 family protein [Pseudomonadota bacterium]